MTDFTIHLFGPARVTAGENDTPVRLGRSEMALLVFLCLQEGRPSQREVIGAELWPDCGPERVRSRLSTAIWRLRGALSGVAGGEDVLEADAGNLALSSDLLDRVDVLRFQRAARAYLDDPAAAPCPCDVAAGFAEPLSGWYDVWALSARVRLEDLRESCLSALLDRQVADGANGAAVETAEALLALDPLREDIYRVLMRLAARQGRPGLIARHFERCRSALSDELGIEPGTETEALFAQLTACDSIEPGGLAAPPDDRAAFSDLRRALQETQVRLARVSDQLDMLLHR